MVRNGDVLEMWLLTISIASAICIEAVPVQESLWKFTPTPPPPPPPPSTIASINSRGLAMIVTLFLPLVLLWLFLIPQQGKMDLHPIFFLLLLSLSHTLNLSFLLTTLVSKLQILTPWLPFPQIRNPGELKFESTLCSHHGPLFWFKPKSTKTKWKTI